MSKNEVVGIVTECKYRLIPKTFGMDNTLLDNIGVPIPDTDKVKMGVGSLRRYTVHLQATIVDGEKKEWRNLTLEEVDALPPKEGVQLYKAIQNLNKGLEIPLEPSPLPSSESTENESTPKISSVSVEKSEQKKPKKPVTPTR